MSEPNYNQYSVIKVADSSNSFIKAWNRGVPFEDKAIEQLKNIARLPFIHPYVAAMPDSHFGLGGPVGGVIPTTDALCPSLVGVDIGCGMIAVRLDVQSEALLGALPEIRHLIEKAVPHGRTNNGGEGDRGAWHDVPKSISEVWAIELYKGEVFERHPKALSKNSVRQLGTLGTGNHFIELSLDTTGATWLVIHSGSRGFGNRIGSYFTQLAKELCAKWHVQLPDPDLAYLPRGTQEFNDYLKLLHLAQKFAWRNREIMVENILTALDVQTAPEFLTRADFAVIPGSVVHCHHNYMAEEKHFGQKLMITRKGAVSANKGEFAIIPGSMGARTYIAAGLGNPDSLHSCSHGAGRAMGRREAERRFTVEDHIKATEGVECHKGAEVLDETPGAYKDIEAVMRAQSDLCTPVVSMKQILCVKGLGEKR